MIPADKKQQKLHIKNNLTLFGIMTSCCALLIEPDSSLPRITVPMSCRTHSNSNVTHTVHHHYECENCNMTGNDSTSQSNRHWADYHVNAKCQFGENTDLVHILKMSHQPGLNLNSESGGSVNLLQSSKCASFKS